MPCIIRPTGRFYIGILHIGLSIPIFDSTGDGFKLAVGLLVIGLFWLLLEIIMLIRLEYHRQERELQRTIDRYKRDYRGLCSDYTKI